MQAGLERAHVSGREKKLVPLAETQGRREQQKAGKMTGNDLSLPGTLLGA